MLNVRLRMTLMVAGLGLGWTLMAPQAATAQCTYDVYPSSVDDVDDGGDSGSLSVTWTHPPLPFDVDPLCGNQWSGVSNNSWISTSTSDTNNFTLYYTVAANPTAMARTGTITVGGHATFTIDQLAGCPSPRVSPTSLSFGSAGGSQTVTVQGAATCTYDVTASKAWIGVAPTTVAGNGSVTVTVGRYTGSTVGSGTVTIGSTSIPVRQCPGSPGVSLTSLSFTSAGGMQTVDVQEAAHCRYGVRGNPTWIRVRPATVAGNGTVTVRVDPNTGSSTLSGTVTIGGTTVPVDVPPPPRPQCTFQVEYTSREVADDPGQYDVSVTASAPDCAWSMTSHASWIDVRTPTRTGSTHGTYGTTSNTTPGSPQRTGTMTVASQTVTITQRRGPDTGDGNGGGEGGDMVVPAPIPPSVASETLTESRERLLLDLATRLGASDLCEAWHSFDYSARNVFIWNTHRLSLSGLLPEVAGMYAMFGTDRAKSCGGEEYNRTFMLMTESLQDKFAAARTSEGALSKWRNTEDRRGPHFPYMWSIETHEGGPRGQIHFFHRSWVRVVRQFNDNCVDVLWNIEREAAERCKDGCNGRRNIPVPPPYTPLEDWRLHCNGNRYTDRIVRDPLVDTFLRGPGNEVVLGGGSEGALIFEMDQDYNQFRPIRFHDSAPVCEISKWSPNGILYQVVNRKGQYTRNYGDPQWDWEPSACTAALAAGAPFTFSDDSLPSAPVRAVTTRELRVRVNSLRDGLGLTPFVWTDPTISSGETPVRAVHMTELRSAITEAYVAASREAPTYTDDPIITGITPIKAVHMTELRSAVIALEQ